MIPCTRWKLRLRCAALILFAWSAGAATHHVALTSTNPVLPYITWDTAATNIQDAIDVSVSNDTVLVSNGVYNTGGLSIGGMTNRVFVRDGVTVQSTDGSGKTVIEGKGPRGNDAIRCVFLGRGSSLIGFTITNGFTATFQDGGGIYSYAPSNTVSDCRIVGNGGYYGGGSAGGTLRNCVVAGNTAALGGGASESSEFSGRVPVTLINCLVINNTAGFSGGGAYNGTLYNSTVAGNTASNGGGTSSGRIYNSIIFSNTAASGTNYSAGVFSNCCATPLPAGLGNITNDPYFVSVSNGNYRLRPASRCIDSGNNTFVQSVQDLDGSARINSGTVDMGAYEHQRSIWYVATNGNDLAKGTNWPSAKATIQAAVDVALDGDTIIVSNGVYAVGSRVVSFATGTNRVAVTNVLTVRSVNGPMVTIIDGRTAVESNAMRCVFLINGASLSGFTLTNGRAVVASIGKGGGIYCGDSSSLVSNCIISGNKATGSGGGVYGGTLHNCLIVGNTASGIVARAGGVDRGILYNCTVVANSVTSSLYGGVGTVASVLYNSIVYGNSTDNYAGCWFTNCCVTPLPAGGLGNFTNNPQFVDSSAGNFRLGAGSPCRDRGSNALVQAARDLDGKARIANGVVDVGAYEYSLTHYVAISGTNPLPPFESWATAATNIQDAVDWAVDGEVVLVSNGVYATGNRVTPGAALSNRVVVTNAILVTSLNGPATTVLQGQGSIGTNPVRCAYLANGATLAGFTLTGGFTLSGSGPSRNTDGGGVYSVGCLVSNCVITGNGAGDDAGGAYGGTVIDSIIASNAAGFGGGASFFQTTGGLLRCVVMCNTSSFYGGGTFGGTVDQCRILANAADAGGGGACADSFTPSYYNNCLFVGNSARYGGGLYRAGGVVPTALNNCIVVGNSASVYGGGVSGGSPNNCIIYSNGAPAEPNFRDCVPNYSCLTPLPPSGAGNITNDPQFVDVAAGNFHLQAGSPCIDRGNNAYSTNLTTDLDGNPRIAYGVVDLGAYEAQFPVGYWVWAGGITNGLTNLTESAAGDGYANLLKYATGGSPTNSDDLAAMSGEVGVDGFSLRFNRNTNANDVTLVVEGGDAVTNGAAWQGIVTNLLGSWGGATNVLESGTGTPMVVTVADTAPPATNRFLRLRVTRP